MEKLIHISNLLFNHFFNFILYVILPKEVQIFLKTITFEVENENA